MPTLLDERDPVDGLDLGAWADAGFTITETNTWGDYFDYPEDAAPYLHHMDPAAAATWHQAFPARPQIALAAAAAGWGIEDALTIHPYLLTGVWHDRDWLATQPTTQIDPAITAYAVDLIGLGATPDEIVLCLRAGLTVTEIATLLATGPLDLTALETLAALRETAHAPA